MATYFWVGGTGTWSGTGNTQFATTSGGVATVLNPTNADTVTFDANSGTAATVTVTSTAVSLSTTINKADINLSLSGSPTLCTAAGTCTLTAGTLTLNTFTLTTGNFSSSNSNVRVLAFGTGKIVVTGNNGSVVNLDTATNFSFTGTSNFEATYSGSVGNRNFVVGNTAGGSQAVAMNLKVTAGTDTVLVYRSWNDVDFTGFAGTFSNVGAKDFYGSLTLSTGMTVSAGTTAITFRATSGTKTITSATKTMDCPITFNGVGGTWQLQDNMTVGSTRTTTLTNGTLNLNNLTLSTGLFDLNNANVRVLAFGTGNITLTGNNTTIFNVNTSTNLVVTGTPVVNCTYSGSVGTRLILGAGSFNEAYTISFNIAAASDIVSPANAVCKDFIISNGFTGTFTVSSTQLYGSLALGGTTSTGGNILSFKATSGTNTITSNSKTMDFLVTFDGVGGSWQLQDNMTVGSTRTTTLTNGTLNLNNFTLTTGLFSSSNSNTRVLAFGTGNIVLTGNAATIWTTATVTGLTVSGTPVVNANYSGVTGTRTITFGALSEANSISLNVSAGTDIVALTATGSFKNLVFTGFAGTLTNTAMTIYGNLTLVSGMTLTAGASATTFAATSGTKTINNNGKTIDFPITFNGIGGTWAIQDAMTVGSTRITTLTNGTLNLNGYTLTTGSFYSDNTNVRVLAFGTGKIVVTSNNSAPINFDTATNFSYTGTSNFEAYYTGAVGVRYLVIGNTTGGSETVAMNLKVTAGTDIVYIYKYWNNLDFTGFAGTYGNLGFKIFYGSFTLVSGMTVEPVAGAETLTFAATSGPKTITSAGKTIDYPTTFDGIGGTWAMQDAFTLGATQPLTFTNGTVQLKSGTTSTVGSFVTTGTNQKYLQATTPGTQAIISDASGTNSVSYLTIQDSYATGGAAWDANASTNVNAGNNFGWFFAPTPADSNEITMRLRSFTQPRRF